MTPHLQSLCATDSNSFSTPICDRSVPSLVTLLCCAWAPAHSTAVRKLSSESGQALPSSQWSRFVPLIVLSLKTIIPHTRQVVYGGRINDGHPQVYVHAEVQIFAE